jgi:hypothetical protein
MADSSYKTCINLPSRYPFSSMVAFIWRAHTFHPPITHPSPITLLVSRPLTTTAAVTNHTQTPPSIPSTMPPIQRDNTTGRFHRHHDQLQAVAAFADAFGEAQQDRLGPESDANVEDELPRPTTGTPLTLTKLQPTKFYWRRWYIDWMLPIHFSVCKCVSVRGERYNKLSWPHICYRQSFIN